MKNYRFSSKATIIAAVSLACSIQCVSAAPFTVFTDRDTWLHQISLSGQDDFESYNWQTGVDNGKTLAWSGTNATLSQVTYTPTGTFYGVQSLTYDASFLANQYVLWQDGGQGGPNKVTIQLPTPTRALGFDFAMFYGEIATYNIMLDNGLTFGANTKLQSWNFFGMMSDQPFQTISITAGLYPVIDNLAWGQIIPEPSSAAIFAVVLALMAGCNPKKFNPSPRKSIQSD